MSNKCKDCEVRKLYAIMVDYHIFTEEDCPYVCAKTEETEETENDK